MKDLKQIKILFVGRKMHFNSLINKVSELPINFRQTENLSEAQQIIAEQKIALLIVDSAVDDLPKFTNDSARFQIPLLFYLAETDADFQPQLCDNLYYLSAAANSCDLINTINLALEISQLQKSQDFRANDFCQLKSEALDSATEGIVIVDSTDKIIYLNNATADIYGYGARTELEGKLWRIFYDEQELRLFDQSIMPEFFKAGFWQGECRGLRQDGTSFPLELTLSRMKNKYIMAIFHDITIRQQALQTLQASEQKYRNLMQRMQLGLAVHQLILNEHMNPIDYRFLEINPAFEKMTGLKQAEAIGKTVKELLPDITDDWITRYAEVVITGRSNEFTDYSEPLNKYYSVVVFKSGPMQFATIIADITQPTLAAAELREIKADLEVKVSKQTAQLQEKITDLERFREATIEREFRIKELNDKLALLQAKLSSGR
ncbi:MAG: PAS domain S-box protein [Candidatus Cloacimonadales bacterium]